MIRKLFACIVVIAAVVCVGCSNPSAGVQSPTTNTDNSSSTSTDSNSAVRAPITLLAISGVIAPFNGEVPVTTIQETPQYTGKVSWSPAATVFESDTAYSATITLTAKDGWTCTGVAANGFTVAGATATNLADTGVITAVFPATDKNYKSANIGILKYVPAGAFQRDATATNISTVRAFRMSRFEITRAQYTAITGSDPSQAATSTGIDAPVQMVNWYDAVEFCNKLSAKENLTPVYTITGRTPATGYPITAATVTVSDWDANGYRLPTEMEWMWAAMGATADGVSGDIVDGVNTGGYAKGYAGSVESAGSQVNIGNYAWYSENASIKSRTVGGKLPNELGLYDMSGNVWEWVWDRWDGSAAYPGGSLTDYRGSDSQALRVRRGGSWGNDATYSAVARREKENPGELNTINSTGLRVVRR